MSEVTFRPARYGDINAIARRLRDIEVLELKAMGTTPKRSLYLGLKGSAMAWTGLVDGRPEAMFGVVPISLMDGTGRPWMLGTERARRAGRLWLTVAPRFIDWISADYPNLENYVHRDNAASIRWLKRLGFTIEPEAVDIGGQPMLHFWRRPLV